MINTYVIILIILLLISISVLYYNRYKYVKKNKNKLYVSSKGKASEWNKLFFNKFLEIEYPNKEIIYTNISNPDLLLVSHFFDWNDSLLYTDKKVPYITWSGEPQKVKNYNSALYNILSQKPEKKEDIWWPYILTANYEMKKGIDKILNKNYTPIENRKNLVAYIASNCVDKRDNLFKLLEKKSNTAHAMGKCSNNHKKIDGDFTILDNIYENYIFGFAMENCDLEGYITEKILNIYNSGAIPIFWGDSKSAEFFFNKESYIDVKDFSSLEEASDYIYNLSLNKEKLKEIKNQKIFKDPKIFQDLDYGIKNIKQNNYKNGSKIA